MNGADVQCDLSMSGVLLQHGEARSRQIEGNGTVPVLCLLVETDSATRGRARVEQPFPLGHFDQCAAAARRYKKGMRVRFEAPSIGIELLVRNATHVHVEHEPAEESAAA